jgi:rhodanese-related sulfurtransferase
MMRKKTFILLISLLATLAFSVSGFAAKVMTPEEGGEGFKVATLEESKKLQADGAIIVACHSHTTDFMKGHPPGTIHITCLTPQKHEFMDLKLDQVNFDVAQLPKDKNTPIITYCASNT